MDSLETSGDQANASPGDEATSGPARILLIDCDMFFVQVARLEDPEGVGRAGLLLVGGSPDGRGVVTSASYEVRAFGVRSGMPTAQALRLCPGATVAAVPRGACQRRSKDVLNVLRRLAPVVQPASIDEFYLDLGGTERLFHGESLAETAERIRTEVLQETEISVSVGGATTRLVAKLAVRRAKPGGVHVVEPGREQDFLREHELADFPGVGPALVSSLRKRGLVRVEDALNVGVDWLQRWCGESRGQWLYDRIRGVDPSPVTEHERRKSISSERTFFRDLHEEREIERRVVALASSVSQTLRSQSLRARTVTVKIRDADFKTRTGAHTLPEAVESDSAIVAVAVNLLRELRGRRRVGVRLLGVGLSSLVHRSAQVQLPLFEAAGRAETERDRVVSRILDDLRARFGDDAIRPGSILEGEVPPPT